MRAAIHTLGLPLLGLLPCVSALAIASVTPRTAPGVSAARERAPLAFSQYGVSYGEIRPYPLVEAYYTFENLGNEPVSIDDVTPSCGCLRWELHGDQRTFAPGERGRLTVRLFTANEQPGEHSYAIDVRSRDQRTHAEQLMFRVTLPDRKVSVEPREVYFYQLHGQADERLVYVTDYREDATGPIEVTSASSTSDQVTVTVLPAEVDDAGRPRVPLRLSVPAEVAPGREIGHIVIETTDPLFRKITLPVLVQGRKSPEIAEIEHPAESATR
jgi:hypothetical protein